MVHLGPAIDAGLFLLIATHPVPHLLENKMPAFDKHIFVCCNQRAPGHSRGCCDPDGSEQLRTRLKAELKRHGLGIQVRANKAGCLDQCEVGPTLVIYPQAIWYGGVQDQDVPRIVEKTILNDELIDELVIPDELLNTKGSRVTPPTVES